MTAGVTTTAMALSVGTLAFLQVGAVWASLPLHRYSFNDPASDQPLNPGVASDIGSDGTKQGTIWRAVFTGPDDPQHPGCLAFDATRYSYVDLPNGIVSSHQSVTIEIWATPGSGNGSWARYWDFGAATSDGGFGSSNSQIYELDSRFPRTSNPVIYDGKEFMILTSSVGQSYRTLFQTSIVEGGLTSMVISGPVDGNSPLVEHHIVATVDGVSQAMELWFDGKRINRRGFTGSLAQLSDINAWIGRSNWSADAFFSGWFNEFRLYSTPLTPLEVAVSRAAGPDLVIPQPGSPTSISLIANTFNVGGVTNTVQARVIGDFAAINGVDLTELPDDVHWESDQPEIVSVSPGGMLTAMGSGFATITVRFGTLQASRLFAAGGAQLMSVERHDEAIRLRWPAQAVGTVEWSPDLSPGSWKPVDQESILDGSWFVLDILPERDSSFYRLKE